MVNITAPLLTGSGVVDVYITEENKFAYVATSGGIDVVNLFEGRITASGIVPDEVTCVAADWQNATGNLYIGTTTSGIFSVRYHSTRIGDFTDSLVQQFTTASTPAVSDNKINDLDALPGRLLIGTASGVDFISNEQEFSNRALISGSNDVHLAENDAGYWSTVSGNKGSVEVNYGLLSTTGTNIITVDFEYSESSNPALPGEPPIDIALTNAVVPALAFATPAGILVTQEIQFSESSAQRKTLTSENAVSVDFSEEAKFGSGKLYALLGSVLRVYDLSDDSVIATHIKDNADASARGQTLNSGTNTIVRTTSLA